MKTRVNDGDQRGFTLLEIMVAMSILAIALTLVIEICAGGLRAAWLSREYTKAVFLAREKMEELSMKDSFTPGVESGELEGGYLWRAEIKPYPIYSEQEIRETESELPIEPYELKLELFLPSKDKNKSVKLSTLLLRGKNIQSRVTAPFEPEPGSEIE